MATPMERVKDLIDDKQLDLLECIEPNHMLISQLIKHKVLQHSWCQDLEGKTKSAKIMAVLGVIRAGTVDQFELFVKALQVTNQRAAVAFLEPQTAAPLQMELPEGPSSLDETPSASGVKLWSPDYPDGSTVVMFNPRYKDILNKNRLKLIDGIDIWRLWACLKQLNVLNRKTVARIQQNKMEVDQVDELINYVERGPMWKLHAFLRACVLTNQNHVLKLLDMNKEAYVE